jgi:hypothetical protein
MMRAARYFGLDSATGVYDPTARPPKFVTYAHHFGGRASIRVEERSMPMHFARGLRDALRTALAQLDAEIAEAGGPED